MFGIVESVDGSEQTLRELQTPAMLVDARILQANCTAMLDRTARAGVRLRPHLKTSKSAAVAQLATGGADGLTVSTIAEAAYFARAGYKDLTYAVGIAPKKLDALAAIERETGARTAIIVDHPAAVAPVAARAAELSADFDVLIEIDTGGRRGGIPPDSELIFDLARDIAGAPSLHLTGVLTHAGHSYHARSLAEIEAIAETERRGAVAAASRLRGAGFACPVVSIGSTPTVIRARNFGGVTEVRPGVYTFFDLTQFCLGVCALADIAASVLTTVIGHNHAAQMLVVDAGALALSKDVSASEFRSDFGYGLVCELAAAASCTTGLFVKDVYQEHGLVGTVDGRGPDWSKYPIGSRLRILPNHACMTAAAFQEFRIVDGRGLVVATWDKASYWF